MNHLMNMGFDELFVCSFYYMVISVGKPIIKRMLIRIYEDPSIKGILPSWLLDMELDEVAQIVLFTIIITTQFAFSS